MDVQTFAFVYVHQLRCMQGHSCILLTVYSLPSVFFFYLFAITYVSSRVDVALRRFCSRFFHFMSHQHFPSSPVHFPLVPSGSLSVVFFFSVSFISFLLLCPLLLFPFFFFVFFFIYPPCHRLRSFILILLYCSYLLPLSCYICHLSSFLPLANNPFFLLSSV